MLRGPWPQSPPGLRPWASAGPKDSPLLSLPFPLVTPNVRLLFLFPSFLYCSRPLKNLAPDPLLLNRLLKSDYGAHVSKFPPEVRCIQVSHHSDTSYRQFRSILFPASLLAPSVRAPCGHPPPLRIRVPRRPRRHHARGLYGKDGGWLLNSHLPLPGKLSRGLVGSKLSGRSDNLPRGRKIRHSFSVLLYEYYKRIFLVRIISPNFSCRFFLLATQDFRRFSFFYR